MMIKRKSTMTARERFFATLNHQPTDSAPANYFAKPEVTQALIQHLGLADEEALLRRFKVDFRRVWCGYELPLSEPDGEGYSRNMWGTRCKTLPGGTVHYICPFNEDSTVADVEAHEWPDARRVDLSHVRAACAKYHEESVVFGAPWSPFFHEIGWFIGQENFLVWMIEKPDVIEAIIRHMVDYEIAVLRRFIEAADGKLDLTYFGNDFGTQRGLFIGLDLWKRFMREPLKRFYTVSHEYGCKVMQHSCGSVCELILLWIEDGVDILDPIQVQATGMEFEKLVAAHGDRITLNGAVDMQVTLPRGTPDDVRREVKRYLAATRDRGGYILCPGQELLPEVPLENIVAMYDANCYEEE